MTVNNARLYTNKLDDVSKAHIQQLIELGMVKNNSYGVVIWLRSPLNPMRYEPIGTFGASKPDAEHDKDWYVQNAHGKARICAETGLDSLTVVRERTGLLPLSGELFPWGGGLIWPDYGIIVATSGFAELEDVYVSKFVGQTLILATDMEGHRHLEDARNRGKGEDPADRFTIRDARGG